MRKQNKKNLRQRMNRLHTAVNSESKYGIAIRHIGSLAKGSGPIDLDSGEEYDLDVDFIIKTDDDAQYVRNYIYSIMEEHIRSHETISNSHSRVIRISVNQSGHNYHFDIAIKEFESEKVATLFEDGSIQ